ncbi:MAG: hypothetical protein GF333_03910 [Candidatus Omnitrophica bacterium]|nr:hypothetical protein [Candidatus Omnitrophota bacterium]
MVTPASKKSGTKKKVLLIGGIVAVLLVGVLIGLIQTKKSMVSRRQAEIQEQEQEEIQREALLESGELHLSPEEIIEREEKIAGEELSVSEFQVLEEDDPEEEPASVSRVTKSEIRAAAIGELEGILHRVLPEGNPSLVYLTLTRMQQKGIDPISALKEEILNNPDNADIRKNAIIGLFYVGGKEVVPLLKTAAKVDPVPEVREIALFCLDYLARGEEASFFKEVAQSDPSEKVKERAERYWKIRSTDQ